MLRTGLLLILMMLSLISCGTGLVNNDDSFCFLASPIYLDKKDDITPTTGREILTYNETGRIKCGWDRI